MASLPELLLADHQREELFADCAALIERYVSQRGGIKGLALKAGLAAAKSARPDILLRASRALVPDFARALDPLYQSFRKSGDAGFSVWLQKHADQATLALIAVADGRAEAAHNPALKAGYRRLRGGAEKEVAALLPELSRLLSSYLP